MGIFETLAKGSNDNLTKVSPVSMVEWFATKYDSTVTDVDTMLGQIGYAESKNKNISQVGGGPGRGLFQFEKTFKNKDTGEYEQAGGLTARNRLAHWYKTQKRPVPKWLDQEGMRDHSVGFDASKLTEGQQKELLLADFWQKKGSDPLIYSALDEVEQGGDAGELWLKKHWAGAEEGTQKYKDKKIQWEREMGTFTRGKGNLSDIFVPKKENSTVTNKISDKGFVGPREESFNRGKAKQPPSDRNVFDMLKGIGKMVGMDW